MNWEKIKLGEIADFSNGINFNKSAYNKGVKLIGVSNFGNRFYPDFDELDEIKKEVVRQDDYLNNGDIVFVRSNGNKELVGRCMLIQNAPAPVTFSGFCIRATLKDKNSYYPKFFAYHFKSFMFRKSMSGTAVGANIQNLSQARLSNYTLKIPDFESQKRIANILSSYDDFIENNQKQIKLLEEAAQRLYKEWFVDFRFPGHENTTFVDGLPEGWKKVNLTDLSPIVTGKKDANFGTKDGKYLFFTCSQEPIKADSYSFDCDAVILAGNGDFSVKLYRGKFEAYQRTYVFSPRDNHHLFLIYYAVKNSMRLLFQGASGSTIKFLTKHMLENIQVFVPTETILIAFYNICSSYQKRTEILKKKMEISIEARDRLLPKLMSGEIEV